MKTIQGLAAQARREALSNGLPCGEHTYSNKCADQEAYRAIEAMPSAEQIAQRQAKRDAEKAACMLEAKTLNKEELRLAIDTLTAARSHSVRYGEKGSQLHWDLIPVISKLGRMLDDMHD
jgi:hypothetical protein